MAWVKSAAAVVAALALAGCCSAPVAPPPPLPQVSDDPSVILAFRLAVGAWGKVPPVSSVRWCWQPDAAVTCEDMAARTPPIVGWWDGSGHIVLGDAIPKGGLQGVMSHEVGHALGIAEQARGLMSSDWTPPVQALPAAADLALMGTDVR